MDWKTFLAQIIDSLAWPAVVIFIVWQLKDKISELLPRIKKFKHKDTELEFAELVTELVNESKVEGREEPKAPKSGDDLDFMLKLADISPRSAVLESFRLVEGAASVAVAKAYPELDTRDTSRTIQLFSMLKGKVLSDAQYKQLNTLRTLRNKAAHMEEFNLHSLSVNAYIDIALTMAANLENYEP